MNTRKYRLLFKSGALMVLAALLYGCYPGGSIPIEDLDTVSTFFVEEDFNPAPTTAALSWEVIRIEGDDDNDLPYDGEVDDEILNTTLAELEALYGAGNVFIIDEAADTAILETVDVLVVPHITLRKVVVGTIYPGYPGWGWGGGWGGWYPGWGGCYYCGGYWPPYVSYTTYEGGSVILDMYSIAKLRQEIIDNGGQVPDEFDPSWVATAKGLISSNEQFNSERVIGGIQKAFEQSPYLSN